MNVENELDIRGLFRALWAGKGWIVGGAVLFAAIVLVYTFFARQEWSATAITDRPTVNMLGGYYSQQQFLRNLDIKADLASVDQPSAMDEAYKEFIMQLASWDTRRDFWLQTDYYKQRQSGNARADAAIRTHQQVFVFTIGGLAKIGFAVACIGEGMPCLITDIRRVAHQSLCVALPRRHRGRTDHAHLRGRFEYG